MPKRKQSPRQIPLESGPYRGMRDTLDPLGKYDRSLAYLLQNVYPAQAAVQSAAVGRPGFAQAGAQLGSSGKRVGQLVGQFTKLAGTEYTVAIVGGQFYTYNWGTDTWTEVVTAANFATATITLSATAICYAVTIADKLFVTDGVNTPWTWDGTSGAGGLTKLTACPVLFGQPTVYYGQVFGIRAANRSTMVWSEVNDPTTGYDLGAFDNSWQLGQSDQEGLFALVGTNAALYYFRARSTGIIGGAPGADFKANGVHDAVSAVTGTQSPGCTVYYEGRVYFVDADFLPFVIVPGAGLTPLWSDVRETVVGMDRAQVANAVGMYDGSTKMLLLGMVESGQTIPSVQVVIDPGQGAGQVAGIWRGFTFQNMASVKNATGHPLLMHLSDDGYAYTHGLSDGAVWSDALNAGTLAITHIVEPSAMGGDVEYEMHYDRLDMNLRTQSDVTNLTVNLETSRGLSPATLITAGSIVGSFSRWDVAIWDTDLWSVASIDQHVAVGLDDLGRWAKPIVTHATVGEQFGLSTLRISAIPSDNDPYNP
jgi:hypothetical protein